VGFGNNRTFIIKDLENSGKVLVVDDDRLVLGALEATLSQDDHQILTASGGPQALEILKREPIAVIICDQRMPGMSGTEVMREAQKLRPDAIRIILTGNSDEKTAIEAINIGQVNQFLVKPWDEANLRHTVRSALKHFALIQENLSLQEKIAEQHKTLANQHANLKRDLHLGVQIYETLLLGAVPKDLPCFDVGFTAVPSEEIDGDFFDFYHPAQDVLDVVIGDVMGKGIPAAVVGIAVKTQLIRFALPYSRAHIFDKAKLWRDDLLSPAEILTRAHEEIVRKLVRLEYFVCLFYGRFDIGKRLFTYVDCGTPKPIIYKKKEGRCLELAGENFPLGIVAKTAYREEAIPFEEGDFFVFYSDGLTESRSPEGEFFGAERLKKLVVENVEATPRDLLYLIKCTVRQFAGKREFDDDLTLVVVKVEQLGRLREAKALQAKFRSDLSQLKAVRDFIDRAAKKAPGDAELLSGQLQLAMNEAFCNIVEHGLGEKREIPIVVEADYEEEGITVTLSEQGEPFNPAEIVEASLAGDKSGGFGWHIIRAIADRVEYIPKRSETGWNHLRLYKKYYNREKVMEITQNQQGEILVITLEAESLDAKDAAEFKQKVVDQIAGSDCQAVVFDLEKLKFIDSSGLGSFLSVLRILNAQEGDLKLANMNATVRAMFELVSMHKIFEIYNKVEDAVRAFQKAGK